MDALLAQHDDWEMEPLPVAAPPKLVEVAGEPLRWTSDQEEPPQKSGKLL